MHSRIFQVSDAPFEREDYITECDYYDHWFTREIADYVNDDCNREDDIAWLKESVKGFEFGKDDSGEYFIVTDKVKYFEEAFYRFKDAIDKIKDCTIDEFVNGIYGMWDLKDSYDDKYGFYIDNDGDMESLDGFIRGCFADKKYYIGGTVDYHF